MGHRAAPHRAAKPAGGGPPPLDEGVLAHRVWHRLEEAIERFLERIERIAVALLDRPATPDELTSAREACAALAVKLARLGVPAAAGIARRLAGIFEADVHDQSAVVELASLIDDLRAAVRGSASEVLATSREGLHLLVVGDIALPVDELLWVAAAQGFAIEHSTGEDLPAELAPDVVLAFVGDGDPGAARPLVESLVQQYPGAPVLIAAEHPTLEARVALARYADAVVAVGTSPQAVLDEVRATSLRAALRPSAVVCGPTSATAATELAAAGVAASAVASLHEALAMLGASPGSGCVLVIAAGAHLEEALQLVRLVRADPALRCIPALVQSDEASPAARLRAYRDGVDDLAPSDLDADELAARVRRAARRAAELDPLLGEAHGAGPVSWLGATLVIQRMLVQATRRRSRVSVAVIAPSGPALGGRSIDGIAEKMLDEFRAEDVVARHGETHLVVGLPGPGVRVSVRRLEAILEKLELPDGSCRIGVAEFPTHGRSIDALLDAALGAIDRAESGSGPLVVAADWQPDAERGPDVVIVEGDDALGPLLADIVSRAGLRALWLGSGDQALDFVEAGGIARCPRVALVEFDLPGLGGLQLLRQLADQGLLGHMKVLMLSTRVSDGDLRRAFALGATDVIGKPVSPLVLVNRLTRVLAG
jgi:DNA-binding response OmpR family regulator